MIKTSCVKTKCYCCGHTTNCFSSWRFEHNDKTYYENVSESNQMWNLGPLVLKYGEEFRKSIEAGEECCPICKSVNIHVLEEV